MYQHTSFAKPAKCDEFESIFAIITKSLESSCSSSRVLITSLGGYLLYHSQCKVEKKTATNKKILPNNTADKITEASSSLSIDELFSIFQNAFLKCNLKEVRVGILEIYSNFFRRIGLGFIESNYVPIVKHFADMVSHPKLATSQSEILFIREGFSFLLRDVIGKMLPEANQIMALKELSTLWLVPPSLIVAKSDKVENDSNRSKLSMIFILNEISSLLLELGSSAVTMSVLIYQFYFLTFIIK